MNKSSNILGIILLAILLMLTCYDGFFILRSAFNHYKWYTSLVVGMIIYVVLSRFKFGQKNEEFLQTFSHEFTHTIVALLFFRKLHSFQAEARGTGAITTDGSNIFISLAPYCLPIFTYFMLIMRYFVAAKFYWIYDALVGLTLAFHIHCFIKQTGNYQTDINQRPLFLSYSFIVTFCAFNLVVIVLSLLRNKCSDIFGAYKYIGEQFWNDIVKIFT